jgi:hypothetical protein
MVSPETAKEAQIQRVTLGFYFCELSLDIFSWAWHSGATGNGDGT